MKPKRFNTLPKYIQGQMLECDSATIRMMLMDERIGLSKHRTHHSRRVAEIRHNERMETYRGILNKLEPFMRKHYKASWKAEQHLAPINNIHIY